MKISNRSTILNTQNMVLLALAGVATVLFVWAATHPQSSEMQQLLRLIRHRTHIDDVGREHHFEQLATETMWRFVFHAVTIGWCLAISVAYLFADRRKQQIRLDEVTASNTKSLIEAMGRNPLAFVTAPKDLGNQAVTNVLTFTASLQAAVQNQPVDSTITKRPMVINWIYAGGDRRKIAVIGFVGLVLLLVGYLLKRPNL